MTSFIIVIAIVICKLDFLLSFTHHRTFTHFNRLFSNSENAESPRSADLTNPKKIKSDQNNDFDLDDALDYTVNKNLQGDSNLSDVNRHVGIVESYVKKITHIWKHTELKDQVENVLKLFDLEAIKNGSKTKLESQSGGLSDYNNLENKLQVMIIKEYDHVQRELSELDDLFREAEKVDIFSEIEDSYIDRSRDNHNVEKPGIWNLILNKLKQKSRHINNTLTCLCNKYLFSSRVIKFLIRVIFPLFKTNIGVKNVNINEILNFYEIPLDENFSLGNIQIHRNNYPSSRKDSWRMTFLGTGSRRVTPTRGASSMAFEPKGNDGPIWLFDCGEGTRLNLLKHGFSPNRVDKIFLTHLHGDHSLGVFSFINDLSKWGKVEIYGPSGIGNMINSVQSTISRCLHKCIVKELADVVFTPPTLETYKSQNLNEGNLSGAGIKPDSDSKYDILESHNIKITAIPIRHNLPTVGYVCEEIVLQGRTPRSICFLQDTCDASLVYKFIKSPDLIIHESTYSTVSLQGTKRYISKRDLSLMDEVISIEDSRSCYDAASAVAMDLAVNRRAGALKKIPGDLVRQMNEMKETQTLFSHRNNSNNLNINMKYHLVLLYNLKKRLALFENLLDASSKIANSITNLKYFMSFQKDKGNKQCSTNLIKFWQEAIKPQLNQSKLTRNNIKLYNNNNKFKEIIEDIVWMYGHSTETMAGRLAGILRAKSLILTHFSSRLPGDDNLESILTMKRIETNARQEMEFAKKNLTIDENGHVININSNDSNHINKVIAAWDGLFIDLPPH